jgi:lipopolysaccharide export system ATP-binding protein
LYFSAQKICKSFGDRQILKNIDISVGKDEIIGILGPNGSGKTTFFSILAGITSADSGTIYLDNVDITNSQMHNRAMNGLIYLPQDSSVFRGLSVENNIKAILELKYKDKNTINEKLDLLLSMFSIDKIRKSKATSLSGGEKRKVEIARALAANPVFLMLDEPFSGIDPISVLDITEIIRNLNKIGIGIIITDHNVRETLSVLHRGYIIVNGEILFHGKASEILQHNESRALYLGKDFSM